MKKVIIILVVLAVVAGVGVLGYWHVRRNTGKHLLVRADVAMRADQPAKALDLASKYTAQKPDDWQGHRIVGQAQLRLGNTDAAEQALERAVELAGDELSPMLLLAGCHSQRAMQLLGTKGEGITEDEIRKAIDKFRAANAVLSRDANGVDTIELDQRRGLNLQRVGLAFGRLADQFTRRSREAAAARAETRESDLLARAQTARQHGEEAFSQAAEVLLKVLRRDPSREKSAKALVRLTDRPSLVGRRDEVRSLILNAEEKPPVAAAMMILSDMASDRPGSKAATPQEAARILDELLVKAPDASEVALARAQLSLAEGDAGNALTLARRVLETNKRHAMARLVEARALIRLGEAVSAEQKLFALKTEFPRWAEAHYLYAEAARATGQDELALESMRAVTRLQPGHPGASEFLAENLLAKGFEDQALVDARSWYQVQPGNPRAVLMYVRALKANDRSRQADEVLETAHRDHADEAVMLLTVSDGHAMLGNAEKARRVAEMVCELEADTWMEKLAIVQAAGRLGKVSLADTRMAELIRARPEQAVVRFHAAQLYARTGRTPQAIEQARKAVSIDPERTDFRLLLARLLLDGGQVEEAYQQCRRILASDPDHAEASLLANQAAIVLGEDVGDLPAATGAGRSRMQLALTYLRAGQPAKAAEICNAELVGEPDNRGAMFVLAEAQLAMDQPGRALESYKKVLADGSAGLSVYMRVAQLLARQAELSEVAATMRKLPGVDAPLVDLTLGRLNLARGEFRAAAKSLANVTSQTSAAAHIRFRAGLLRSRALALAGELPAALNQLDELAKTPGRTTALLAKSSLLTSADREAQADAILAGLRSQAIGEKDPGLLGRLVRVYLRRRDYRRALELSTVLAEFTRDAWTLHADVLRSAGEWDKAEQWYRKAIAAQPGQLRTPLQLAELLAARYRFPEALEVLRRLASRSETAKLVSLQMRARYYAGWGLPAEALRCIEELDEVSTISNPNLEMTKARALAALGEKARARELFAAVPDHSRYRRQARQMLVALADESAEKKKLLATLAEAYPDDPAVALQRIDVLVRNEQYAEAADAFVTFDAKAPGPPPLRLAESGLQALVRANLTDQARELIEAVARRSRQPHWTLRAVLLGDPNEAVVATLPKQPYVQLMKLSARMARAGQAKEWDAVAKNRDEMTALLATVPPKAISPHVQLLDLLADITAGRVIDARQKLDGGFGRAPSLKEAATELVGYAEQKADARVEAAGAMEAMIAREVGMSYLTRRISEKSLQARPKAQWAAALIVQVKPERRDEVLLALRPKGTALAAILRADQLLEKGEFAEAAKAYRDLLKTYPANWALTERLAIALERSDGRAEALELYKAVWDAVASPAAANNAAYLVSQLHADDKAKLSAAIDRVDQAIQRVGRLPSFLDTKGWLVYLQGDPNAAAALIREAILGAGNSVEIHYHLAVVEQALGNDELARMHYQAAVDAVQAARKDGRVVEPADAQAAELAREAMAKRKEAA